MLVVTNRPYLRLFSFRYSEASFKLQLVDSFSLKASPG
jgi:hypothetical protein